MKELRNFISDVVNLWDIHQHRENLYKSILSMHNLGTLRRICSQGYFSSMLYKKEILWVYDLTKSTLDDGDIRQHSQHWAVPEITLYPTDKSLASRKMLELENRTIKLYQALLSKVTLNSEETYILKDHLEKLRDISQNLTTEINRSKIRDVSGAVGLSFIA